MSVSEYGLYGEMLGTLAKPDFRTFHLKISSQRMERTFGASLF